MKILSNINYYYHEIVTSNIIKKSTELTAAVAFYTFHSIKTIVALPASPICSLPDLIFSPVLTGHKVSRMMEKWNDRISRPTPAHSLARMIHRVDSIANWIFEKMCYLSLTVPLYPYKAIIKGANYIEHSTTEISQKVLNAMHIPVQLSISQKKLESILEEWKNQGSPGEDRQKASRAILCFYEQSRNLISNLRSPAVFLSLENCQLQDLPDIFHHKPFSTLRSLNLSGNQLSTFPENIGRLENLRKLLICNSNLSSIPASLYNLPKTCMIYTDLHKFSIEEIKRMPMYIHQANYTGPQIFGMDMVKGAVLFAEILVQDYIYMVGTTSENINPADYEEDELILIEQELMSIQENISLFDSLSCEELTDHLYAIHTALINVSKRVGMEVSDYEGFQDKYQKFVENSRMYRDFVEIHLDNKDAALTFLIQHDKWKEALRHNKATAIADIEREREQASDAPSPDYEAIQNSYDQALKDLSREILDW